MSAQEKPPTGTPESSVHEARRPYKTPELKALGSVRNLTYGTGELVPDGGSLKAGPTPPQ